MLHWCVLLCGSAVMIIELTGSRILAPFLGTSLVVWTSLIGIILASLSLGAWSGGILADRYPRAQVLGRIILLSAWATAAIGLSKTWLLELIQGSGNLHVLAIAATTLLFSPASVLLGMIAPYAVRLRLDNQQRTGRIAGNLYAMSTIGSIFGTFLAGFVLIAWLGSTAILFITSAILVIASFMADTSDRFVKAGSLAAFLLALLINNNHDRLLAERGLVDIDTPYNRVLVYTSKESGTGRPTREMVTGPLGRQSAMYLDDNNELAVAYTRFYRLAEHFKPDMRRMLVLGGGGFSFPKFALQHYPELQIDVVELDPGIVALARAYFGLVDHPRLKIIEEDARTFLQKTTDHYDVILCDVFTSHYSIPFHLVTIQAIEQMRSVMTSTGVLLINILASQTGKSSQFYSSFYHTLKKIFKTVTAYAVEDSTDADLWQNIILLASANPILSSPPPQSDFKIMLSNEIRPPNNALPPFTDDYAPVDRYTRAF